MVLSIDISMAETCFHGKIERQKTLLDFELWERAGALTNVCGEERVPSLNKTKLRKLFTCIEGFVADVVLHEGGQGSRSFELVRCKKLVPCNRNCIAAIM